MGLNPGSWDNRADTKIDKFENIYVWKLFHDTRHYAVIKDVENKSVLSQI